MALRASDPIIPGFPSVLTGEYARTIAAVRLFSSWADKFLDYDSE